MFSHVEVNSVPVSASTFQAEAEVVHSFQVLSWKGIISQLSEVLSSQILPPIAGHCVIAFNEKTSGGKNLENATKSTF